MIQMHSNTSRPCLLDFVKNQTRTLPRLWESLDRVLLLNALAFLEEVLLLGQIQGHVLQPLISSSREIAWVLSASLGAPLNYPLKGSFAPVQPLSDVFI
ncbi:hypothetical protein AAFF_G00282690 [Aldrovandia affinis]|uniref:Uncharacterized protein n=1 Tax=Aldrovandia affinis TaxID=143900 RepID=A0AAD7X1K2_9TELE|nr:hypothetical protein AAFF_G00282690 [Aldrovandia affinis]